jgi:hypothetical protein
MLNSCNSFQFVLSEVRFLSLGSNDCIEEKKDE